MIPARTIPILLTVLLLLSGSVAWAGGLQGRVAWRGELVPEVTVRAYRGLEDLAAGRPLAVSEPTGVDGTYRLELPAGRYVVTAASGAQKPAPGDFFCYYSGSPVTVAHSGFTNVGFNLVRVPEEAPPETAPASGLRGEVSYRDEPLERCYLYVYRDAAEGFKGPGYVILPVERGSFRLRLPPGEYYLLARKRAQGGRFGPIEIGDHFNFYHGNPVRIEAGEVREVKIETITRLSMLEEGEDLPFRGVRGTVMGPTGSPLAGIRVFAYADPGMTGTPDFFSSPSGADGRFSLPLPGRGPYYLLARESFGGPASESELYGRFDDDGAEEIRLEGPQAVREVTIHVARQAAR